MGTEFLGKGWKFPIALEEKGQIALSEYEEDIRESVRIILLTSKGERVMRPDFGSGLRDLVFATINASTLSSVKAEVQDALIKLEPRIQVLSVRATSDVDTVGKLLIDVEYRVRATNTKFNLVFPYYLKERV